MKNKFLIGLVTFFSTLAALLFFSNFVNSDSNKSYSFERVFSNKDSILNFTARHAKMDADEYIMAINSDDYIVERDREPVDSMHDRYKFYYTDLRFGSKQTDHVILPSGSNVLHSNPKKVIYTNNFRLFELDKSQHKSCEILIPGLKVTSLKALPDSDSKFLCFSELKTADDYETGFFVIDFNTKAIRLSKLLVTHDATDVPTNSLRYSGSFSVFADQNTIAYGCNKFSKIYFFDNKGNFKNELNTADATPLPEVIQNSQGYTFYKRGHTWNTNMGVFVKNNKAFVFSASSKVYNTIIVDEYSLKDFTYVQSHKIKHDYENSQSVRHAFIDGDKLVIGFETHYASFIFSRYI